MKLSLPTLKKCGFTLIELLVVIAVVSLLAAILFPVFARARENSRRSSCQSNLKQLALGMAQYIRDFDERYPRWVTSDWNVATDEYGWSVLLSPYLKSKQILQCPSEATQPTAIQVTRSYTDYTYNLYFYGGPMNLPTNVPRQSQFTHVSKTIMHWDYRQINSNSRLGWPDFRDRYINYSPSHENVYQAGRRHQEGANYTFVDGHVKWYKPNHITCSDPASTKTPTFRINTNTAC